MSNLQHFFVDFVFDVLCETPPESTPNFLTWTFPNLKVFGIRFAYDESHALTHHLFNSFVAFLNRHPKLISFSCINLHLNIALHLESPVPCLPELLVFHGAPSFLPIILRHSKSLRAVSFSCTRIQQAEAPIMALAASPAASTCRLFGFYGISGPNIEALQLLGTYLPGIRHLVVNTKFYSFRTVSSPSFLLDLLIDAHRDRPTWTR